MNYSAENNYLDAQQRLSRRRNFQLIRDIVSSYNENARINNQYMLEYIQSMRDIIDYIRDMNNEDVIYYDQLRTREPTIPRPNIPSPRQNIPSMRTHFNPILPGNNTIPIGRSSVPSNRVINMNLEGFLQGIIPEILSTDTDNNTSTSIRTFTTHLNGEHSNNSQDTLYRILMRGFYEGNGNLTDIGNVVSRGLNAAEIESGVIDISYNATIHGIIDTHCPIVLEDFEENERIKQIVECGHIFKAEPLMRWFSRHTECPICRCELTLDIERRDVSLNIVTNNSLVRNVEVNSIPSEEDDE